MGRIMGIDYGSKRIGLAITDRMQMIASPLATVPVNELESYLLDYASKEQIDEFVIGYPVRLNNKPSESVKYIQPFLKRLAVLFPDKPVHRMDERYTSVIAQQSIIEGGVKKKKRRDKSVADRVSASLILRSYLERRDFKKL
jgi:putative Holliday junction resolvase